MTQQMDPKILDIPDKDLYINCVINNYSVKIVEEPIEEEFEEEDEEEINLGQIIDYIYPKLKVKIPKKIIKNIIELEADFYGSM